MARLCGCSIAEVQAARLKTARKFADEHGVVVVLKGRRTVIALSGGEAVVNTSGNPGMAKGGSGDLLTGMVAGLLAQALGDKKFGSDCAESSFSSGVAAWFGCRFCGARRE